MIQFGDSSLDGSSSKTEQLGQVWNSTASKPLSFQRSKASGNLF